jgi:hypothetical protein
MEFKIQDEYKILEVETYSEDELHLLISNKDNDFLGEIILDKEKAIELAKKLNNFYCL